MAAAEKKMFVRHVHTGQIREVTPDEREQQDKNYWVRITGDDVKATEPETVETTVTPEGDAPDTGDKTASKATPPKK